jgi:CTP synthase
MLPQFFLIVMKYIFVSGGVVSGLGKGVTTASLAFLLKSRGFRVTPVKVDMYLNIDAGTIRPQEHGEVFVTHDGIETDEDLGHYERFLHENLTRQNYITTGQIYQEVIRKERNFEYQGEDVEAIPHVTDEIIRRITLAGNANNAQIVIVELGGTVGEYQNGIFYEASRILKLKHPNDVIHVHVTYLPFLQNIGELKSKPAQTSVRILNGMGIQPDMMVARSALPIDKRRLERLALFCNINPDHIFAAPDLSTIYQVPLLFHKQNHHLASQCLKLLKLKPKKHKDMKNWQIMTQRATKAWPKKVQLGMVGKYFVTGDYDLIDSYVSVVEAIRHAAWKLGITPEFTWIDSEKIENLPVGKKEKLLKGFDGIIVPQGWGSRGTEGKIESIKFAREKMIPYLGLCFGMQMATIEFGRNVLGLKKANSTEVDPKTPHPVIHVMPEQAEYLAKKQYGGTIRLGAWPCVVMKGTLLEEAYHEFGDGKQAPWWQPRDEAQTKIAVQTEPKTLVFERHRHRYEFNNDFKKSYEDAGFVISGTSPDGKLVEAIEIKDHPFFVGTQFHPEYISRPLTPHPIFVSFLNALKKNPR